jgi:hypothetical protein
MVHTGVTGPARFTGMTAVAGIAISEATMCAQVTGLTRMEGVDADADDVAAPSAIRMA